jgi:bla regulator protein BlaR1
MGPSLPELLSLLARLAFAGTGAMLLVLLARRPLRRLAGAQCAYLCWLVVPAALLAAALPALPVAHGTVLLLSPARAATALAAGVGPAASDWAGPIVRLWACGALATGLLFVLGQRTYVRSLGALQLRDGVWYAAHACQGPALLGLVHPRVVVPADFATRYNRAEQALILAHERAHAARRDPCANALLALLRCLFWFHPLMHIAQSRFRFDQELACDAAVMARDPSRRQAYAAAMLKTQASGATAPATCHWQTSHPLKERIMQLKQATISTPRRRAGRIIVALLACASVLGAVGARADGGQVYDIAVAVDGVAAGAPMIRVKAGEEAVIKLKQPGQAWTGVFSVTPAASDAVTLKMKVTQESGKVIAPTLLLHLGETGHVVDGDPAKPNFRVGLTVTRVAGA